MLDQNFPDGLRTNVQLETIPNPKNRPLRIQDFALNDALLHLKSQLPVMPPTVIDKTGSSMCEVTPLIITYRSHTCFEQVGGCGSTDGIFDYPLRY